MAAKPTPPAGGESPPQQTQRKRALIVCGAIIANYALTLILGICLAITEALYNITHNGAINPLSPKFFEIASLAAGAFGGALAGAIIGIWSRNPYKDALLTGALSMTLGASLAFFAPAPQPPAAFLLLALSVELPATFLSAIAFSKLSCLKKQNKPLKNS